MKIDLSSMFEIRPTDGLPGVQQFTGGVSARGLRIGIVASRFNPELTGALVAGAVATLTERGVKPRNVAVAWVPGAFELPVALKQMAESGRYHALIAFGAVLAGATIHAQTIAAQVSRALVEISLTHRLPVIDGVVCADTLKTARERCLNRESGRGWYCAMAAIETATLLKNLPKSKS